MSQSPDKKSIRVIIITDSTGMPRQGLPYTLTWPSMIREKFPSLDVVDRPQRGGTTARLVQEGGGGIDLLELYDPDIAVIQMGITDCAPRLFRREGLEYRFINTFLGPGMRNRYIRRVRRTRVRDPLLAYVSMETFRLNVSNYINRASALGCHVILVGILPAIPGFIEKSPHIAESIERYNRILMDLADENRDRVSYVSPLENVTDIVPLFMDDIHPNYQGSLRIFASIEKVLRSIIG